MSFCIAPEDVERELRRSLYMGATDPLGIFPKDSRNIGKFKEAVDLFADMHEVTIDFVFDLVEQIRVSTRDGRKKLKRNQDKQVKQELAEMQALFDYVNAFHQAQEADAKQKADTIVLASMMAEAIREEEANRVAEAIWEEEANRVAEAIRVAEDNRKASEWAANVAWAHEQFLRPCTSKNQAKRRKKAAEILNIHSAAQAAQMAQAAQAVHATWGFY
jgi:hypothetical protein